MRIPLRTAVAIGLVAAGLGLVATDAADASTVVVSHGTVVVRGSTADNALTLTGKATLDGGPGDNVLIQG